MKSNTLNQIKKIDTLARSFSFKILKEINNAQVHFLNIFILITFNLKAE